MSKSKKNTIDPETMINQYGADAVRWFILSDSPPEKDIQWSATGVSSSNKFLQKIWDLNQTIFKRMNKKVNKKEEETFINKVNLFINKIDKSINEFKFNVSIALFYECHKFIKDSIQNSISDKLLRENFNKILKLMIPFTPHLANECLEINGLDTKHTWPEVNNNFLEDIKIAVQINGKTRDIITIKKDLNESEINKFILNNSKAKKYIKKIKKTIFIKNKIINYLV